MKDFPQIIKTKYLIKSVISEDKSIFLANRLDSGEECIIKCIDSSNSDVYSFLKTAKPEGIPEILDIVEEEQGDIFIVERFIEGNTLTEYVEKGKNSITESWVKEFVLNMCGILHYLHDLTPPIIHRDIKPDNIIISNTGDVYLIDFNISRFYVNKSGKGETSRDTLIMGTVDFAAPEQFGFMESDARTDIYGLGATIQFVLDKTGIESPELEAVVDKCKQFSPNDRYQSAKEIITQLSVKPADWPQPMFQPESVGQPRQVLQPAQDLSIKYAPPGFRTGSPWKMGVALVVYFLCFSIALTMNVDTLGVAEKNEELFIWMNRIGVLMALLIIIAVSTNYAGVQRLLFKGSKNISSKRKIVYIVLADIAIFVFFAALTGIAGVALK